jgi:hypothetical protein
MDPVIVTTLGLRMRRTKRLAGAAVVVALIPAHDEEAVIESAIQSLRDQDSPPDLIIVLADNCTDETAGRATAVGAFVHRTVHNRNRKAGALNQALAILLPELRWDDAILVMDADSVLPWMFLSEATERLRSGAGAVSAGTATLVSAPTLRHLLWAREVGRLPGGPEVYDSALGDLPHALLHLGYKVVSPQGPSSQPLPATAPVDLQGSPTPA